MRAFSILAIIAAASMPLAMPSALAAAHAAQAKHYTTAETTIAVLLADPAAKAVLMMIIPEIAGNEQIGTVGGQTLKAVQPQTQGFLTDAHLAQIDAELAKLPAK